MSAIERAALALCQPRMVTTGGLDMQRDAARTVIASLRADLASGDPVRVWETAEALGLEREAYPRVLNERVLALSKWVDQAMAEADPTALLWARTAKVAEEAGEVISAVTDYVGANPRRSGEISDVVKELLDVALAALGAVAHIGGNIGDPMAELNTHAGRVCDRAGLTIGRAEVPDA